jgi:hypothetical protein
MAKRVKKMPALEFEAVQQRRWAPVRLVSGAIPEFLRAIPKEKLHSVLASGTQLPGVEYSDRLVTSGELIGGIDVYRHAPEDPVELNKDWYAVLRDPRSDAMFLVSGPIKDGDHWLDELSPRVRDAEIVALPKKPPR